MIDINKNRFLIIQILKEIYSDIELSNYLGLKGETVLMLFHELPRVAVDLDFNLIDHTKEKFVLGKMKNILLKYGNLFDLAIIFFGQTIVVNYGAGNRRAKIEISNHEFNNHYEIKNLLGINIRVMTIADMFARKLCELLDYKNELNRNIFDIRFLLNKNTAINKTIIEAQTRTYFNDYLQKCINRLASVENTELMDGMDELVNTRTKNFIETKLLSETINLLKSHKER